MPNLQIKRNKNIFNSKENAVSHLNSLVGKLKDGEIVLVRYYQENEIQTLIGIETKFENENKEIISTVTYYDSFNEIGLGFVKDENGVTQLNVGDGLTITDNKIKVLVDSNVTNFLSVDENGVKVVDMNANVTKTTKDIIVMGGPLATDAVKNVIDDKDSSNNPYIKTGTNVQELLEKLFCKEKYPVLTDDNYLNGTVSASIKRPIITFSNTATTVEVGTFISASTISFNGNSVATSINSKVSGLEYGYSLSNNSVKYSSSKTIETTPTTGYVTTEATKMICEYTGFTVNTFTGVTGTTVLEKTNCNLGQIVEGDNTIKVTITGQPISYTIDEINSVYPCSNIGNTKEELKTKKIESQDSETNAPTNSNTKTIVGVRYGFYGMLNETQKETFSYTSNEIRSLTSLTEEKTFNIKGDNVAMVVIAIPNSWGVEINEIRDAEQMNSNLFGSTTGYDSENYDADSHPNGVRTISVEGLNAYQGSDYKVYTFSPDSSIVINQTVTFK